MKTHRLSNSQIRDSPQGMRDMVSISEEILPNSPESKGKEEKICFQTFNLTKKSNVISHNVSFLLD